MQKLKILSGLAIICLSYNLIVVLSVALNSSWVNKLAAGGQFTNFPLGIRAVYGIMSIAMVFLIFFVKDLSQNPLPKEHESKRRTARLLAFIFVLSTFTQLISRSPLERWNAIPALIISYAFWTLSRSNVKNTRGK